MTMPFSPSQNPDRTRDAPDLIVSLQQQQNPPPTGDVGSTRFLAEADTLDLAESYAITASPIPPGIVIAWPSTAASIPAHWTRVTSMDSKHPKGVPNTSTDPGTTGGALTHIHTAAAHTHTGPTTAHTHTGTTGAPDTGSNSPQAIGSALAASGHTHAFTTGSVAAAGTNATTSGSWNVSSIVLPLYVVIWIESDGATTTVPSGALILWPSGAGNPTGYSPDANATNAFLVGAAAAGDGGGTQAEASHVHTGVAHTHTIAAHTHGSATTGAPSATTGTSGALNGFISTATHTHTTGTFTTVTGSTSSTTSTMNSATPEPPWVKLLVEKAGSALAFPIGGIAAWRLPRTGIPANWQQCDGTNGTPNLLGKYVKGAANAGEVLSTGGTLTHTHTPNTHTHATTAHTHVASQDDTSNDSDGGLHIGAGSGGADGWSYPHMHYMALAGVVTNSTDLGATDAVAETVSTVNHEPPYREICWIERMS